MWRNLHLRKFSSIEDASKLGIFAGPMPLRAAVGCRAPASKLCIMHVSRRHAVPCASGIRSERVRARGAGSRCVVR